MTLGRKLLWGSFGWAMGGPIGAILGYTYAKMTENQKKEYYSRSYPKTKPGDFVVSLLVLFAKVMKADGKLLKSELNYVKQFLSKQFDNSQTQDFMILFKDILEQDYPLSDVCKQIQKSMDHSSRIELIHVLFGLSKADGHIDPSELNMILTISNYLNVNKKDFESIKAMFFKDPSSSYKVLEAVESATDHEIKKAYRKMANKYHPDKVAHLGNEIKNIAEDKFKAVNAAYSLIKKDRGIK